MTNKVKGTCVPVEYLVLGMLENNVYIISDGKATIVVDPTCKPDEIIKAAGGKLAEPEFTDKVTLRWQMPEHTEGPLLTQLQELTRGTANVTVSEPFYAAF